MHHVLMIQTIGRSTPTPGINRIVLLKGDAANKRYNKAPMGKWKTIGGGAREAIAVRAWLKAGDQAQKEAVNLKTSLQVQGKGRTALQEDS